MSEIPRQEEAGELNEPTPEVEPQIQPQIEIQQKKRESSDENEDAKYIETEKTILRCADNPDFQQAILPQNPEQVNAKVLDGALETLLRSDGVELSKLQRLELFKQTLEYYSTPTEVEVPLLHSASSFSLLNAINGEGFRGGYGKFLGELSTRYEEGTEVQRDLSVTHPVSAEHPEFSSFETFQQMFARAISRKDDLDKYLSVDSEKITGQSLPELFVEEFLSSLDKPQLKKFVGKRMGVNPEEVTDEQIEQATGEEVKKAFIDSFKKREDTHKREEISRELLPRIEDEQLRDKLEQELDHPFPCFITFEGAGKEENLTTVSRKEQPTHIPFEDKFWGTLTGEDIREIRVPQSQIEKVFGWLQDKGIEGVKIVPIEVYEVKRIIQNNI